MTPDEIRAAQELVDAATPGPWVADLDMFDNEVEACVSNATTSILFTGGTDCEIPPAQAWTKELQEQADAQWAKAKDSQALRDAAFIAASRTLVPQLLSALTSTRQQLAEVEKVRADQDWTEMQRFETARERDKARAEVDALKAENERLASQLHAAEFANSIFGASLADHAELNGHVDIVKECCDYLDHEAMDSGDLSGKLRDFVTSLSIVVEQFDRHRRSRNWYEAAYKADKQKLIDCAVEKATNSLAALAASEAECGRMRAVLIDVHRRTGINLFDSGVDLGAIRMVIQAAIASTPSKGEP